MGRSFFFSHFFTPGSVSQLSCSVSGPGRWLNIDGPEAPWKSGGDCRSEGFFSCKSGEIYVWHMWHMTLWDSDIAVLQTPVLDIYHGVLLPWFHTRDQEKNATMGASDCQPIILLHSGDSGGCVRFSSTLKLDGGQDLWVWVPWSLDLWLFNVISVTSHPHFFIPSMVTSDFRMA